MTTLDLTTAGLIQALRPATAAGQRMRPPEKICRAVVPLRETASDKVDMRRER